MESFILISNFETDALQLKLNIEIYVYDAVKSQTLGALTLFV